MSRLSQFFSGSTSGFIDVEVFILSGGGGGGSNGPGGSPQGYWAGCGGGGAVYYGKLQIAPGTTCPIIVGAGGAGNTNHITTAGPFHGSGGGASIFTTPTGRIRVYGGGGGGGSFDIGMRGGCSGGSHGSRPLYGSPPSFGTGRNNLESFNAGSWYSWGSSSNATDEGAEKGGGSVVDRTGAFYGYPGGGRWTDFSSYNTMGGGGAGGAANGYSGGSGVFTHMEGYSRNVFTSKLYGTGGGQQQLSAPEFNPGDPAERGAGRVNQGEGGISSGAAIAAGKNGSSGIVLINYPSQFGAATVTGGGSAISFSGGYGVPSSEFSSYVRGYRFTSSGSITFP